MCGIIGYVGARPCKELVLTGLEHLEYRGYDSAGMVLVSDAGLERARAVGPVKALRAVSDTLSTTATVGMGHTRWATHGVVEERNAHPFLSEDSRFGVLMNGIFENYIDLRAQVAAAGHTLTSDTDTEALVHMLKDEYDGDLAETVRRLYPRLEGHFAFLVVCRDEPDRIVGARLAWPPLVVGRGEGETFLASFTPAFLEETRSIQIVEEGEIVIATADGVEFRAVTDGSVREHPIEQADESLEVAAKGGYETFMLKEIHEQPTAIADTIAERFLHGALHLDGIGLTDDELRAMNRVLIVGCGTALHAGLVGRYLIEDWGGVATEADVASEWRYRNGVFDPKTLVIAISQSGETADTLAAMQIARERGARVVAVTNIMGSAVSRAADGVLYTRAGLEIGVAASKTFTSQVTLMTLLALHLGAVRGNLSTQQVAEIGNELRGLPDLVQRILDDSAMDAQLDMLADRFAHDRFFLYLGRHLGLPICQEGALKLKEISYIPTDAYAAGEMKHGPIALLGDDTPVVAVATDSHVFEKMASNLEEVRARGAHVIAVGTEGNTTIAQHAEHVLYVPRTRPELQPILAVIPLQMLAYKIAGRLGLDVDRPRNLAKTVTVE
ncbi:MAG: glutamine--fructose-6-phosphate transaminase (isomerizing) [Thermoleophilia bacterium]|nr:glutamine--fructose-6-phosphate transaminase (isomerizing) [Thermoleophilia bacterium]